MDGTKCSMKKGGGFSVLNWRKFNQNIKVLIPQSFNTRAAAAVAPATTQSFL